MSRVRRHIMRDAWRLAKPYWTSEEKWSAWGLLLAVIALTLGNVYVSVQINEWNRAFYNALQYYNSGELFRQVGVFGILVVFAISMSVFAVYLNQMLQIRWRRWLTRTYLGGWLTDRAYYHLQLLSMTDNPDQRISEDLSQFTTYVMNLSIGLISSAVSLASFLYILWKLSGPAEIPLGPLGVVHIPAFLVWIALLYAGVGTWLTSKLGRPLVPLNFARQRFEADFRFSLVRLRENAESVALYGGEENEKDVFQERFTRVFENFLKIMKRQRLLSFFTSGYAQVATIFPVLVVAPRYFGHMITLGGLLQVVNAFSFVQNSLSFIINAYPDIAALQAITQRLSGFDDRLNASHEGIFVSRQIAIRREGSGVSVNHLNLDLPNGTALLRNVSFDVASGEAVLLMGPTGGGKSTLLRALAGIWPFGSGQVRLGDGRIFFVPQRPYLPLGSLARALIYPSGVRKDFSTAELTEVLEQVGLGALGSELDGVEKWAHRLSLGEQQRLAFGRILLVKPAILFLDESTSSLDEQAENQLYDLIRKAPWRPTIVSVGHKTGLFQFHDKTINLTEYIVRRVKA
jgi:putative ATP-binding cassette transporter